jgi:solute carrier family 25 ornithine transporter 2/15
MLREVFGCFFFFLGNECSKSLFVMATGRSKDDLGFVPTLISGGVAGVAYWTSIFPLDTIKSKLQVRSVNGGDGMIRVGVSTWQSGGVADFYKGLAPCALRAFPSCAALFVTFEYSKQFLTNTFY